MYCYSYIVTLVFTFSTNDFAGLKAGMLWAGISIAVFFYLFLPVLAALVFTINDPNPLK